MYSWREDIPTEQEPSDQEGKGRYAKLHPNPRRRDRGDRLSRQRGVRPGHRPGCARLQHEPSPQCVEASRLHSETGLRLARASHSRRGMLDYDISGKAGMTVTVTGKGPPPPINPLVENVSRTVVAKLESVMWDFEDAKTNDLIHNIHPYPAKFIPQIPRELIRLFHPGRGQVVFDPFCGSGTTLVESVAAGIPAVGVDLNPLAVLISKVKTNLPGKMISPVARQIVGAAHQENVPIPDIPRLDHWFLPDVQQVLSCLVRQINLIEEIDVRDALKITLSRIIVRVSNQDSDTRYAAVKKDINKNQVYDLFVKSAEAIDRAIAKETGNLFRSNSTCRVLHRDILDVSPEDIGCNVGLVVTSPPYPNAYEYWLYHKYLI